MHTHHRRRHRHTHTQHTCTRFGHTILLSSVTGPYNKLLNLLHRVWVHVFVSMIVCFPACVCVWWKLCKLINTTWPWTAAKTQQTSTSIVLQLKLSHTPISFFPPYRLPKCKILTGKKVHCYCSWLKVGGNLTWISIEGVCVCLCKEKPRLPWLPYGGDQLMFGFLRGRIWQRDMEGQWAGRGTI